MLLVVGKKSDVELREDFFPLAAAPVNDRFEKLEKWIDGSCANKKTVGWRSRKGAQKAVKKVCSFPLWNFFSGGENGVKCAS